VCRDNDMSTQSGDVKLAMELLLQRKPRDYVVGVLVKRGHPLDAARELVQNLVRAVGVAEEMRSAPDTAQRRDKQLQKLLLLHVRDQTEPPELGAYSEQERTYNSALLIREGYVLGEVIQDGSGFCASTIMTELTSKGHDLLEAIDQAPEQASDRATESLKSIALPKLIFISHSSADEDLATALVDMLRAALNLRMSDFLCTSVDGAKLKGGDVTDDVLRTQIREVPAFLSLLTAKAVASTYVLFELGARWGCGKHHIPLLAKGAGTEVLKEPLKSRNALRLSRTEDCLQLAQDLCEFLHRTPEPAHSYLQKVHNVVRISGGASVDSAVHGVATARLKQCITLLRSCGSDFETGLKKIRQVQNELPHEREQITVISNDTVRLHLHPNLIGQPAEICWVVGTSTGNRSLYPEMKAQGNGFKVARITGYERRPTAIAFETVHTPSCMVVAEAHSPPEEG